MELDLSSKGPLPYDLKNLYLKILFLNLRARASLLLKGRCRHYLLYQKGLY